MVTTAKPTAKATKTVIITGNQATALAAKLCRVQVIAAYPITPQTPVTEALSEYVEKGELKAEYVTVESEHSALSVCSAASTVGARAFTATSGNGLTYMHEVLHWAAGSRLPLVLGCVNRAVGAPWNVLNDQQDSISQRDTGWIQLYARNHQEILDSIIQAYKIAESMFVPVMVCYDGYLLSHTVAPVEAPSQEDVDRFLPPYSPQVTIDPAHPVNLNQVTLGDPRQNASGTLCHGYMEFRYLLQEALENSRQKIIEVDQEFGALFGRSYGGLFWSYRMEDAEVILVAMGSLSSEATVAADALRDQGCQAGVLGLRAYRPFPTEALREALRKAKLVAVFDKNISYGYEGATCSDLRAALYSSDVRPPVHNYIAGIGGRDVKARELVEAAKKSLLCIQAGQLEKGTEWLNCQI